MTAYKAGDPTTIRRLYGRRQGPALRPSQLDLLEKLLPQIAVPDHGDLSAATLFDINTPLHIEIGMGSGEHLAYRADLLPDHGFIGCEPYINGVVAALQKIRDGFLPNIRLYAGNAIDVLERLPDASVRFIYLLHPDPWPKARHAKRRFINHGPMDLIARKIEQGGEFRLGTDDPTYLEWAMMIMGQQSENFEWLAQTPRDWQKRPAGWSETRYEAKARAKGHDVWYFRYRRK